jgi:hypothetical protein
MNQYPPQHPGYPPQQPYGYPQPPSYPPYVQPAQPPRRKSNVGWWILLGCLGMFGACGALVAFLPDAPQSASSKEAAGEGKSGDIQLREDVPKGAAKTIQKAREAIRANDFEALQATLSGDDAASYRIDGDLEAKTPRAAIEAWRKKPEILKKIDAALAAKCEVDPPDEGHILVSCGTQSSGAVFVILSNMMDASESKDVYRIYSVGEVY